MKQYGFYYDAENCIGCHTCHIACKDTNRLEVGKNFRTVRTFTTGSGFTPRMYHLSMACNHCEDAVCIPACENDAISRDDCGLVVMDAEKCIGCGNCAHTCPYHAIIKMPTGKAGKCEGCATLRALGEEVACVASCPQRVLFFGPIDELKAKHASEGLVSTAAPLPPASATKPNLVMRVKDCMDDMDFDEIVL